MSEQTSAAAETATTEREMLVEWSRGYWFAYQGTRAQLEAEGIIPTDNKWPEKARDVRWEANGLTFTLSRHRPPNIKGPMSVWLDGDWWRIWVRPIDDIDLGFNFEIERRAKEMRDMLYARTREGQREHSAKWARIYAARDDEKFLAFKALIPGLIPPPRKPRGRRPKSAIQSQEA